MDFTSNGSLTEMPSEDFGSRSQSQERPLENIPVTTGHLNKLDYKSEIDLQQQMLKKKENVKSRKYPAVNSKIVGSFPPTSLLGVPNNCIAKDLGAALLGSTMMPLWQVTDNYLCFHTSLLHLYLPKYGREQSSPSRKDLAAFSSQKKISHIKNAKYLHESLLAIRESKEMAKKKNASKDGTTNDMMSKNDIDILKLSMIPLRAAEVWGTKCDNSYILPPMRNDHYLLFKACWKVTDADNIQAIAFSPYV